jgi:zinc transporter 1/2/3
LFEGLAIGGRLAGLCEGRPIKKHIWWCAFAYAITTPLGISIGIACREHLNRHSKASLVTIGVFDSLSAGMLLYGGLVGLVSSDFHQAHLRDYSMMTCVSALGAIALGLTTMA